MTLRAVQPMPRPAPAILAVVGDDVSAGAVDAWVQEQGIASARVVKGTVSAMMRALEGTPTPARLIVDISGASDPVREISDLADVCDPGCKVLVLGERNDITLYRELLALGAEDYLVKPVTAAAINRAFSEQPKPGGARQVGSLDRGADDAARRGTLVAVVGARGGVGASTVAGSLAWVLAADCGARTALVDIDLQLGTGALMLDVEPGHGFKGALENPDRIDGLFLERAMVRINDRLSVLCAEEPLTDTPAVSGAAMERLFDRLADSHDWVVIDVPRNAQLISRVLPKADQVVVVTDRSLAGVRDSLRLIALASEGAGKVVHVVVNRQQRARGEDLGNAMEKALGRPISVAVPFDASAAAASAAKGQPLVAAQGRSPAAKAMRRFGRQMGGEIVAARPLWQRWMGGR